MLPPTPNSIPSHGGPRQFDKRYSAGRTAGGSWTRSTRSAFVSAATTAMRDRVAASVWSACARRAYGAGVRGGHHACCAGVSEYGRNSRGSVVKSGNLAGAKSDSGGGGAAVGCLRSSGRRPEPEDEIFRGLRLRSGYQRSLD